MSDIASPPPRQSGEISAASRRSNGPSAQETALSNIGNEECAKNGMPGKAAKHSKPLSVVLVDDDRFILDSLAIILGASGRVRVAATSTSGHDVLALYRSVQPDIVLLDIRMPEISGLAAAEELLAAHPEAVVVFLTTFADDDYLVRALAMGARGYLIKQQTNSLEQSLFAAARGQTVLGSEVSERIGQLFGRSVGGRAGSNPLFSTLGQRELEVARLISEGLDNREIAGTLYLSEGTVRNYISTILQKTGLRDRTQIAIAWWRQKQMG